MLERIVTNIYVSFLFSGCLASFLTGFLFYYLNVKKDIKALQDNNNKKLLKILTNVFKKMESEDYFPMRTYPELRKENYSKEEAINICEEKVQKIVEQRNIQLKQFIEDAISGE